MNLHDDEVRVTSETGGQKGKKLARLGAIDPVALIALARVAGMGADKYDSFNYLKGYDWSLCFDAMMRHALLFWAGEDLDEESGQPHMAHAAWHALALVSFLERGIGKNDRAPGYGDDRSGYGGERDSRHVSDSKGGNDEPAYRLPTRDVAITTTTTTSSTPTRCEHLIGPAAVQCHLPPGHAGSHL